MVRLLLASIGLAVLQLGGSQPAGTPGIRTAGETSRSAPALEVAPKASAWRAHDGSEEYRLDGGGDGAPSRAVLAHPPMLVSAPGGAAFFAPAGPPLLLPRSRGPPA